MSTEPESIIFENGGIKVTNLRAVINAKTYAMSNVTSVEANSQRPIRLCPSCLDPNRSFVGLSRNSRDGFEFQC